MRRGRLLALACLGLAACADELPQSDAAVPDAAAPAGDLGQSADGGGPVFGAFTIVGCTTLDTSQQPLRCTGPAPLSLTFVPLGQGVTTFVWSFPGGDPDTSRLLTPSVSYGAAGVYSVTLAAGGGAGTTTATATIIVGLGGPAAACTMTAECDTSTSLQCFCGDGTCADGLAGGLCSRTCLGGGCGPVAACADLTRGYLTASAPDDGGVADAGAGDPYAGAFRSTLCLPMCALDSDCRAGLSCRELPVLASGETAGGAYLWQKACFASLVGDVGAACLDAFAQPDASRCLTGHCESLGARGLCTQSCASAGDCPSYAPCASFNGPPARGLCLTRCDATHPCTDPLMECAPSGRSGELGFTVAGAVAGNTFCAPKACAQPADCAPAGVCTAGFCRRS